MGDPSAKKIAGLMIHDMQADHDALMKTNRMFAAALVMAINEIERHTEGKKVVLTVTPEGMDLAMKEWCLDISLDKDEETMHLCTRTRDEEPQKPLIVAPTGSSLN